MSYNGWKNWETWNVALWCDNEEPIYRDRMRQKPATAENVEAFVREWFPQGTPDMKPSEDDDVYAEHKREAVDWEEIASHWADDYADDRGDAVTIEHEMRALMAHTDAANKTMAQRGADMPLRPKTPQRPRHELGDLPLFGDGHKQLDLIDVIRGFK